MMSNDKTYNGFPVVQAPPAINYHTVIRYIEQKHNYKVRGFNQTHGQDGSLGASSKYLDFWHYALHNFFDNVTNDSYHFLYRESADLDEDCPAWVKLIVDDIFEAVGTEHPAYNAEDESIHFHIWW